MGLDDEERVALFYGLDIQQVLGHAMCGFDDGDERLLQVQYRTADADEIAVLAELCLPGSKGLSAVPSRACA
jgi:hypothetical protein